MGEAAALVVAITGLLGAGRWIHEFTAQGRLRRRIEQLRSAHDQLLTRSPGRRELQDAMTTVAGEMARLATIRIAAVKAQDESTNESSDEISDATVDDEDMPSRPRADWRRPLVNGLIGAFLAALIGVLGAAVLTQSGQLTIETGGSAPSDAPTDTPTESPSETPSESPSESPSETPSESPSETPTEVPTEAPTGAPDSPDTDLRSLSIAELAGVAFLSAVVLAGLAANIEYLWRSRRRRRTTSTS